MGYDKYSFKHVANGKIKLGATDKKDDRIPFASNPYSINFIPNVFTAKSGIHF